jgi:hypothetical protein
MSALTTHAFGNQREKEKEKKWKKKFQQATESQRKAKSKITWRRHISNPLGKGNSSTHPRQNYAQAKTTNHQSIQELPLYICMLPLNKCQPWAQTGQASSTKTGQTNLVQQTTPPKSQKCKTNAQAPPWLLGYIPGMQCNFSPQFFLPLLPMHESRLKFENMQPRASQVYQIHHKMLHMSKWAS